VQFGVLTAVRLQSLAERLLNVIDGMDWEAIDGEKEGMADAAAP
jgi:hypothetical protein